MFGEKENFCKYIGKIFPNVVVKFAIILVHAFLCNAVHPQYQGNLVVCIET